MSRTLVVVDVDDLEERAARKGRSLTTVAGEAGIDRNTVAKMRRRQGVLPRTVRRLEAQLASLPDLPSVSDVEVAS